MLKLVKLHLLVDMYTVDNFGVFQTEYEITKETETHIFYVDENGFECEILKQYDEDKESINTPLYPNIQYSHLSIILYTTEDKIEKKKRMIIEHGKELVEKTIKHYSKMLEIVNSIK